MEKKMGIQKNKKSRNHPDFQSEINYRMNLHTAVQSCISDLKAEILKLELKMELGLDFKKKVRKLS